MKLFPGPRTSIKCCEMFDMSLYLLMALSRVAFSTPSDKPALKAFSSSRLYSNLVSPPFLVIAELMMKEYLDDTLDLAESLASLVALMFCHLLWPLCRTVIVSGCIRS